MKTPPEYSRDLEAVKGFIQTAVDFAEQWPEPYRPAVLEAALRRIPVAGAAADRPVIGAAPVVPADAAAGADALISVATAVGVEPDLLRRVVNIDPEGRAVRIMGRIHGESNRELQNRYSVVYAYVKEKAFGDLNVSIEELRQLCRDHRCYDVNNFTKNFTMDTRLNEMRGVSPKRYVPTKTGLEEAAQILRQMANA